MLPTIMVIIFSFFFYFFNFLKVTYEGAHETSVRLLSGTLAYGIF